MKRFSRSLPALIALLLGLAPGLLLFPSPARSAGEKSDAATPPITKGQRVFTCGHSFHVFVYKLLDEVAKSAGIADHQSVGLSSIGGSRVIQHWEIPDDKFGSKAARTAGKVDVLTLSPIWLPDEGIDNFAKLGVEHNPDIRIFVQEFWLPNDEYEPVYPLQVRKGTDHNATDMAKLKEANDKYCHDVEEYVGKLNKTLGKESVFVVPVGEAADKLREKLAAGQAPGLKMQWDLFRDSWGHPDAPLQALDAYCFFAAIYHRSPVGLPMPKVLAAMKTVGLDGKQKVRSKGPAATPAPSTPAAGQEISQEDKEKLNRLLQEIAWETVSHHPLTGVSAK
ncbi:MAG: hypothetical protein ABJF10_12965 [Chthoniobacter sp.]|uniref:hypothetical protein n=1 Tax=Chthoniobacter sp. TaxID=2510640 RepID=UPI0032ADE154